MLEAKDTGASVFQKKKLKKKVSGDLKKKGLQTNFSGELQKKGVPKMFSGDLQNFNRGKGNFRRLEASRPRSSKCVFKDSTSDDNS